MSGGCFDDVLRVELQAPPCSMLPSVNDLFSSVRVVTLAARWFHAGFCN
jgi:hypothetical protein